MKRCPTCRETYKDDDLNFCLADGDTLQRTSRVSLIERLKQLTGLNASEEQTEDTSQIGYSSDELYAARTDNVSTSSPNTQEEPPQNEPRGRAAMICPHCQVRGKVFTTKVSLKKGISGGKATGALLTGGLSLLATGLSRKEEVTKARCFNCDSEWLF